MRYKNTVQLEDVNMALNSLSLRLASHESTILHGNFADWLYASLSMSKVNSLSPITATYMQRLLRDPKLWACLRCYPSRWVDFGRYSPCCAIVVINLINSQIEDSCRLDQPADKSISTYGYNFNRPLLKSWIVCAGSAKANPKKKVNEVENGQRWVSTHGGDRKRYRIFSCWHYVPPIHSITCLSMDVVTR